MHNCIQISTEFSGECQSWSTCVTTLSPQHFLTRGNSTVTNLTWHCLIHTKWWYMYDAHYLTWNNFWPRVREKLIDYQNEKYTVLNTSCLKRVHNLHQLHISLTFIGVLGSHKSKLVPALLTKVVELGVKHSSHLKYFCYLGVCFPIALWLFGEKNMISAERKHAKPKVTMKLWAYRMC